LLQLRLAAQLTHPNVLAVYDVLESEGARESSGDWLVVVTERAAGIPLRRWLREASPSAEAVLRHFVAAGHGLAAAHRLGLVHGRFGAGCIEVCLSVVQEHERTKVAGFGLSRLDGTAPRREKPEVDASVKMLDDQFAFCLALRESLQARTHPDEQAQDHGAVPGLRPSVGRAVQRGLHPNAAQRWPDMEALLAALQDDAPRRRLRRYGITAVGVVGVVGVAFAAQATAPAPRCKGGAAHLAEAWNPERKQAISKAIGRVRAPYAEAVGQRVRQQLDAYTRAWIDAYREACEATSVEKEQSFADLDLRMACLQRVKTELFATLDVLHGADDEVVARAHKLVDQLPAPERCADVERFRAGAARAPEHERERVERVHAREQIGRAHV